MRGGEGSKPLRHGWPRREKMCWRYDEIAHRMRACSSSFDSSAWVSCRSDTSAAASACAFSAASLAAASASAAAFEIVISMSFILSLAARSCSCADDSIFCNCSGSTTPR